MNEAQKVLLERAIKMLNACGVKYAIQMDDGGHIGPWKVSEDTPKRSHKIVNNFKQYGYAEIIEGLAPGANTFIPFAEGMDKKTQESFASSISAKLVTTWGKGNGVTARSLDGKGIEVIRVE